MYEAYEETEGPYTEEEHDALPQLDGLFDGRHAGGVMYRRGAVVVTLVEVNDP